MLFAKISIIIPVYNRKDLLTETLRSIFKTDYPTFEVIVVDDASTEDFSDIVKNFQIIYIKNSTNSGPSTSRNKGVEKASGDIILFVDSDIILNSNTLNVINFHLTNPNYDAIMGVFSPDIRYYNFASNFKNLYMHYVFQKMPSDSTCFVTSLAAVRKNVFEQVGGFDEQYGLIPCEDTEIGLRIATKYKILLLKELQVEHVRYYSLVGLLKTQYKIASGLVRILLRYNSKNINYRKDIPSLKSFTLGVGLSGLALFLLLLSIFIPKLVFVSLFVFFTIILININFLFFLKKEKNIIFFLKSCFFIVVFLLSSGFGTLSGIIGFFIGKKYIFV